MSENTGEQDLVPHRLDLANATFDDMVGGTVDIGPAGGGSRSGTPDQTVTVSGGHGTTTRLVVMEGVLLLEQHVPGVEVLVVPPTLGNDRGSSSP